MDGDTGDGGTMMGGESSGVSSGFAGLGAMGEGGAVASSALLTASVSEGRGGKCEDKDEGAKAPFFLKLRVI